MSCVWEHNIIKVEICSLLSRKTCYSVLSYLLSVSSLHLLLWYVNRNSCTEGHCCFWKEAFHILEIILLDIYSFAPCHDVVLKYLQLTRTKRVVGMKYLMYGLALERFHEPKEDDIFPSWKTFHMTFICHKQPPSTKIKHVTCLSNITPL